jgi:alpha-beta hydrolase superfamily lysophospholipase
MKPCEVWFCWLLLAASWLAGCGVDSYAERLLQRNGLPGETRVALAGCGEELLGATGIGEHLRVPVDEGVVLDVRLICGRVKADRPRGTVLLIHGLWDSKVRYLGLGRRLAAMGFDAVLPDLRAHGRSTGRHITYGALEKVDMKRLVDRLLADGKARRPLYVFGVSMGAAVAVRYAAIDPRCEGVLAVAPYRDARVVVRGYMPLMSEEEYEAVWARAAEIGHFDPNDTSTTEAAARLKCPLIVVHGKLDTVVPYSHGKAVYDAAHEPKQLISVPWAGHTTILAGREKWFAQQVSLLAGRPLDTP